jgi:hypothetical protein
MGEYKESTDTGARTEEEEVLAEMLERFELAYEWEQENREEAEADLRILCKTWTDEEIAKRDETEEPSFEFPILHQYTDQVIGDWRQNRANIIVRPAPGSAEPKKFLSSNGAKEIPAHEAWSGLIRSIHAQSAADIAHDGAFEQAACSGFGHWRIITAYEGTGFEQCIKIARIKDQFSVYWDPGALEWDRSDANWCIIALDIPKTTFEDQYPDAVSGADLPVPEHLIDWYSSGDETVRVAEYFRKVPVKKTVALLSDGRIVDYDERFEAIKDELALRGVVVKRDRVVLSHKIEWRKCTGTEILEGPIEWPGKFIPVVTVTGKEQTVGHGKTRYRSLIRNAHDGQKVFTVMRTLGIEAMALAPRAPFVVGASQIGTYSDIWRTANTINHGFLPYDDSRNPNPPKREQPGYPAQGYFQEALAAREDVKAMVGMYDAAVGARSNETSGKAILARQKESDVMSFPFIDNMGRALQYEGRVLVDLIPKIYDTQRTLRILNEDETDYLITVNETVVDERTGTAHIINDLSDGIYDVTVDVGPSYTTRRIETAEAMMQFIQAVPAAGAISADIVAKAQDWAGAEQFAKRLRWLLPPEVREAEDRENEGGQPLPPHVEMAMKQAEETVQVLQAQLQELQAKMMDAATKGQKVESENAQLKVRNEADKQASALEAKRQKLEYDQRIFDLEKKLEDQLAKMQESQQNTAAEAAAGVANTIAAIPKIAESMQQLATGIAVTNEQTAKAMSEAIAAIAAASARMAQAAQTIAAYTEAERTLVYDGDGNVTGVSIGGREKSVSRAEDGSVQSIQ